MKYAWLLLACSFAAAAQDDRALPKVFVTTVQPGLGPAHALQLDGTTLVHTIRVGADAQTQRITPSPEQWTAFRRALDSQKVWRWRANYRAEGKVADATSWTLKLEYADRALAAAGAGGFPDRASDRALPKYAFNRYQLALQELIGRPFGRGVKPIEVFDVRELRLVATHPAPKEDEQWAEFRDPTGKRHRAALHEAVGGLGLLEKVDPLSVSVSVLGQNSDGEWVRRPRLIKLTK